jgi:hypothetical protein
MQTIDLAAFMSADFFGAREQEKWRPPFLGEDFVDVTRTAGYAHTLRIMQGNYGLVHKHPFSANIRLIRADPDRCNVGCPALARRASDGIDCNELDDLAAPNGSRWQ